MSEINLSLLIENDQLVAHKLDCPAVHLARARDEPIMTMLGCAGLPEDLKQHSCLTGERQPGPAKN